MLVWSYFKNYLPRHNLHNFIIITSITVLIGVFWEFSEFIANQTLVDPLYRTYGIKAYFQGDIADTMKDFVLDILGAASYFLLYLFWDRRNPSSQIPRDK
jgi:hypothetical protein